MPGGTDATEYSLSISINQCGILPHVAYCRRPIKVRQYKLSSVNVLHSMKAPVYPKGYYFWGIYGYKSRANWGWKAENK
jgi:hypothetical protein